MKTLISIGSIAIGSIALNLMPVQPARAVILQNGDFSPASPMSSTVKFGNFDENNLTQTPDTTTVTGWTSEGYNFLVPSGNGISTAGAIKFYGSTLSAPNGASHFVAGDSAYGVGRIYQDLNDLEVGQTYSISFYQAAAQQNGPNFIGETTDAWIVNVGGTYTAPTYSNAGNDTYGSTTNTATVGFTGGTTYESPTMTLADQGAAGTQTTTTGNPNVNGWQQDSFVFTATSENTTTDTNTGNIKTRLSFLAKGTPVGKPPFALLSGVSASKIPEPDTYVGTLLGLGIVGTVVKSRLTKKKLEDRN
jgi:hypothetical protein